MGAHWEKYWEVDGGGDAHDDKGSDGGTILLTVPWDDSSKDEDVLWTESSKDGQCEESSGSFICQSSEMAGDQRRSVDV